MMVWTTGTVTVSSPWREISSAYAPKSEATAVCRRQRYQGTVVIISMETVPTAVAMPAMLQEPSQVLWGSANLSFTGCVPIGCRRGPQRRPHCPHQDADHGDIRYTEQPPGDRNQRRVRQEQEQQASLDFTRSFLDEKLRIPLPALKEAQHRISDRREHHHRETGRLPAVRPPDDDRRDIG